MAEKKRAGLGRGLAALLDEVKEAPAAQAPALIPIHQISPNLDQPRRQFDKDALSELAGSIRQHGVLQPILVRRIGDDAYEIVAGERRWRAAQQAELHEIPAVVRDFEERDLLTVAIVENVQRADLNAIEEARSYQRLHEDFGISHEEIGQAVGKSRSHISNLIRILDLPARVQQHVLGGRLTMGHARALVGARDPEKLAEEIIARGYSVREAESRSVEQSRHAWQTGERPGGDRNTNPGGHALADVRALEKALADALGLKVSIAHAGHGGRVQIRYAKLDQLDMLCQRLTGGRV